MRQIKESKKKSGSHDGAYVYVFSGTIGTGIGAFKVVGDRIAGGDFNGVTFVGQISGDMQSGLEVMIDIKLPGLLGTVQKLVCPVTRTVRRHSFMMPENFADGRPFEAPANPGSV